MPTTNHDPIDFTFADDGDLVRKAPKAVPEDPVEKRLQREREAAPFILDSLREPLTRGQQWIVRPLELTQGEIRQRYDGVDLVIDAKHSKAGRRRSC
jgi:hypothetical protein